MGGGLSYDGEKINFLGRQLPREGDTIHFELLEQYLAEQTVPRRKAVPR